MAMTYSRWRSFASRVTLVAATLCLILGAQVGVLGRNCFRAKSFGDRAADSLDDPRVAAFVADQITTAVVHQSPDLIAARPLLLGTAQGLVAAAPFRAIVRRAARRAHEAVFSEKSQQVVLSMPDFAVLLRSALEQASPQLAAKIPERVQAVIASLNAGKRVQVVVHLWRLGMRLRWSALLSLFLLAPLLMGLSLWLAPDRQRAVVRAGIGLLVAGILTALALPAGRMWLALTIEDPLLRGAAQGLWRTYLWGLVNWGLLFAGLGILFAAGGSSFLDFDLRSLVRRAATGVMTAPVHRVYTPEEFSCAPNRGGTHGSLFQINHWIQTTPNPHPSNAAIVNTYDLLLQRVQRCAKERKHLPNIIAVDFYHTGDLFRVVQTLNDSAQAADRKLTQAPKKRRR